VRSFLATNAHAQSADDDRGIGLRNGFSLSAGTEFGTTDPGGQDISGQLFGVDWRIGMFITNAISVYWHNHLSFGSVGDNNSSVSGSTGNFATAVMGEYMLPQRFFFAGGGGYGVLNNPNGPLAELRAGWYPFKKEGAGKARRLNVALDARWYFVDGLTMTHIALSLGYDRF
jgi:hypothetical protein